MNDIEHDRDVEPPILDAPLPVPAPLGNSPAAVEHDIIWWKMVASSIVDKDWDNFILVLEGIIKRLKGLVPHRADVHKKIDASVPLDSN